jgi:hypothetical protein
VTDTFPVLGVLNFTNSSEPVTDVANEFYAEECQYEHIFPRMEHLPFTEGGQDF